MAKKQKKAKNTTGKTGMPMMTPQQMPKTMPKMPSGMPMKRR